ncbi:MAG: hypothetical protein II290_09435 [Oscillospiraceae bacterium]|nr:hypothetical protein [Oscillospiraceae bacterium]
MKRWIWALAALALLWSPKSGVDVGKLRPVQVVCLAHEGAQVEIRTDVGAWGAGMDISAALEALYEGAEGVVVLDTAEYLLVDREDPALILEIGERLRPSCMVCIGDADPETVGAYLQVHGPETTVSLYRAGERRLSRLEEKDGRLELVS